MKKLLLAATVLSVMAAPIVVSNVSYAKEDAAAASTEKNFFQQKMEAFKEWRAKSQAEKEAMKAEKEEMHKEHVEAQQKKSMEHKEHAQEKQAAVTEKKQRVKTKAQREAEAKSRKRQEMVKRYRENPRGVNQ